MTELNMQAAIEWAESKQGKLTYSMERSRNGDDGTADCSGFVTQAIVEAGAPQPPVLFSTESIHAWLKKLGFALIAQNEDWDSQAGDIPIWGQQGYSAGSFGHILIMVSATEAVSCSFQTQGEEGTAVQVGNYNDYFAASGSPYTYVYRYMGAKSPQEASQAVPNIQYTKGGEDGSIAKFKAAGDAYDMNGKGWLIKEVSHVYDCWQGLSNEAGGSDPLDWYLNGLPLGAMERTDGGDEQNYSAGTVAKFTDDYATGTIDFYDEASNGVGITMGDYGVIWFDADALYNA